MKSFLVQLTDELAAAIELVRSGRPRQAVIEELLWSSPRLRAAAKRAGIVRQARPERGKYDRQVDRG